MHSSRPTLHAPQSSPSPLLLSETGGRRIGFRRPMSSFGRRSSISSSSRGVAKRPTAAGDAVKAAAAAAPQQAKKRVALGNLTNVNNGGRGGAAARPAGTRGANKVTASTTNSMIKKAPATIVRDKVLPQSPATSSISVKSTSIAASKDILIRVNDEPAAKGGPCLPPCSPVISPNRSGDSVSFDETMSTCDSMKSPEFEYIDNVDSSVIASLEWRTTNNLRISEHADEPVSTWKKEVPIAMETTDKIIDVDNDANDPQLCATLACDIYKHLRESETKKRPSTNFMDSVQKDINPSMRGILIDWLVEVAEEYRLVPDTLFLTVNYIDRYLSGNEMNRQRLQLLGVACMLIAAKYEEICAPQVEEFCYITDNTYFKDEVLQMEADVLRYLKFEMTAPTAKCFLRRFVRVAQECEEDPSLLLEFLANYVAELSLLEYNMLCYSPSLIAASSIFLARYILQPKQKPWNVTLAHYTLYNPSELCECAKALHQLICNSPSNSLPAIRDKYSQHKYKFVAKKFCPPSIPSVFFEDPRN